jgi:hypothetical protein
MDSFVGSVRRTVEAETNSTQRDRVHFLDWLLAVSPRFPEFEDLVQLASNSEGWPSGHDKTTLSVFLQKLGRRDLIAALERAVFAFDLLCMPSAPVPDEMRGVPWEWHNSSLVERSLATTKRHDRQPNVSTSEYRWRLGRRLARQLSRTTRILIDTCHWIKMRDCELGRTVPAEYSEILRQLRWLVGTQRYVCPITPALFLELQTQIDRQTRMHTADLMEELSHNVVLPDLAVMEKLELRRRAFDTAFGTGGLNVDWQLWTRPAFLLGELWPVPEKNWMTEQQLWWVQKSCIDSMWESPLTQVIGVLDEAQSTKDLRADFERLMNDDRRSRPQGDFELERQRAGAVVIREIIVPAIAEIIPELQRIAARRPGYRLPELDPNAGPDPWCLPSVQIVAGIEALIRTTNRRFHGNDMFDLFHCAAALPYCNVFFCDGPFERIIKDPKLRYDEVYNVKVLSSPRDILRYLERLA